MKSTSYKSMKKICSQNYNCRFTDLLEWTLKKTVSLDWFANAFASNVLPNKMIYFCFPIFFWISLVLRFFCKNSVKSEVLCFFRGKAKTNHLCQAVQRGAIHLLLSIVLYRFLDVAMEVRVHPLRLLLLRPIHCHERKDKGPFNYYVRT